MRFNEEVQWADEDYQLGVLDTLADEGGLALARALDLGVFHGINPLDRHRGRFASSPVTGSRPPRTASRSPPRRSTTPDLVIEQAAGLVIADGYIPNGIAFDPTYAVDRSPPPATPTGARSTRSSAYGANVTAFEGLAAFSSSTVSALPGGDEHQHQGHRRRSGTCCGGVCSVGCRSS